MSAAYPIALRRVAAAGLETGLAAPVSHDLESDWDVFIEQRLVGLAARVAEVADDVEVRDAAAERHLAAMSHAMCVERVAARASVALAEAGIAHVFSKGLVFAHRLYPDPSLRPFADADVVVAPSSLAAAGKVLERLGGRRLLPETRPGFDAAHGKDVPYRVDGVEIDLHRTLAAGPLGMHIDTADMLACAATMMLAGVPLPIADTEMRFLHACYNAVLGDHPPRLMGLRDVVQSLIWDPPDTTRVRALATRWGGEAVVAMAISSACEVLDVAVDHELVAWAQQYRSSPRDRLLLSASTGPRRGWTRNLAHLAVLGGSGRRTLAAGLVRPSAEYRRARGRRRLHAGRRVSRAYRGKRALDLAIVALSAPVTVPVALVSAIAVAVSSPGPVLFRQERVGLHGVPFTVLKFRTMVDDDNPIVPTDDLITPVGRILRRTSLDELPQLVNVVRGEMSVVGPRPTLQYQVDRYTPEQRGRLLVAPGLTGWAQVNGRNELSWDDRIIRDLEYVERGSLHLDLEIIWRTFTTVVLGRGVAPHVGDDPLVVTDPGSGSEGSEIAKPSLVASDDDG